MNNDTTTNNNDINNTNVSRGTACPACRTSEGGAGGMSFYLSISRLFSLSLSLYIYIYI